MTDVVTIETYNAALAKINQWLSDLTISTNGIGARLNDLNAQLTVHITTTAKAINDLDARLTALEAAKVTPEHECDACMSGERDGWQPKECAPTGDVEPLRDAIISILHPYFGPMWGARWTATNQILSAVAAAAPELPVVDAMDSMSHQCGYWVLHEGLWEVRVWNRHDHAFYEPGERFFFYSEIRGPIPTPR